MYLEIANGLQAENAAEVFWSEFCPPSPGTSAGTLCICTHVKGWWELHVPQGRQIWPFWSFCQPSATMGSKSLHLSMDSGKILLPGAATSRVDIISHYKKRVYSTTVLFGIKKQQCPNSVLHKSVHWVRLYEWLQSSHWQREGCWTLGDKCSYCKRESSSLMIFFTIVTEFPRLSKHYSVR